MADEIKSIGPLKLLGGGPGPKPSLPPLSEETAEPLESPDSEAGDMATQGVMSALEDKDPVAFRDALTTLLESMGYSKV